MHALHSFYVNCLTYFLDLPGYAAYTSYPLTIFIVCIIYISDSRTAEPACWY